MAHGRLHRLVAGALKMALAAACVTTLIATSNAQQLQQIQAVVDGLTSPQHAAQANEALTPVAGVVMSRLDHHTKNLFMHVSPDCALDATGLRLLLEPYGLNVRCVQRREVGPGPFRHLDPQTCDSPLAPAR